MTWRRALTYWACCGALVVYYFVVLRQPADRAAAHLTRAPFINIADDNDVQAFELRRGSTVVRCRRIDGRWQVTEPPGSRVPADLVGALVTNLTQLPDVEVVADAPTDGAHDLTQFGLAPPISQLVLTLASGRPITVRLGSRNPAGTAVYAQRDDSGRVFLIGLNVRYYEDLLFEALGSSAS